MATQDNSGIDYFSSVPEGIKKSRKCVICRNHFAYFSVFAIFGTNKLYLSSFRKNIQT